MDEKNYPYLDHPKYKGIERCIHGINRKYCVVCSKIKPKSESAKKSKIIQMFPEK